MKQMKEQETPGQRGRPSRGVRESILAATLALISDRGLATLTTKEIAERAGASEASIYYHFADKAALVEGVIFDAVLKPLEEFAAEFPREAEGKTVRNALTGYARTLNDFWERVLPVLSAVQADVDLREEFATRITDLGYGPHRGVRVLAQYLEAQQQLGRVRTDVDPRKVAMSFAGACFLSAYQRHMFGAGARKKLPKLENAISTLVSLIESYTPRRASSISSTSGRSV
jgi:AcrR family transcriptional regulator